MPLKTTSTSLLLQLKKNENPAWERFDSLYLRVVRQCWCKNLTQADRDEIAQDTALRVRKAIANFDRQRNGSFRKWLRTIVGNLLKDFYAKNCSENGEKRNKSTDPEILEKMIKTFDNPDETELQEEKRLLYQRAVQIMHSDFSEKWVHYFEGIVIYGRTSKDLAEELGMSEGAVRKAKYKVLQRLKEEFAELLE